MLWLSRYMCIYIYIYIHICIYPTRPLADRWYRGRPFPLISWYWIFQSQSQSRSHIGRGLPLPNPSPWTWIDPVWGGRRVRFSSPFCFRWAVFSNPFFMLFRLNYGAYFGALFFVKVSPFSMPFSTLFLCLLCLNMRSFFGVFFLSKKWSLARKRFFTMLRFSLQN